MADTNIYQHRLLSLIISNKLNTMFFLSNSKKHQWRSGVGFNFGGVIKQK